MQANTDYSFRQSSSVDPNGHESHTNDQIFLVKANELCLINSIVCSRRQAGRVRDLSLFWTRGFKWEEVWGRLLGAGNILYLNLGSCYTSVYTCINSKSCTLKICVLHSKVIYKTYIKYIYIHTHTHTHTHTQTQTFFYVENDRFPKLCSFWLKTWAKLGSTKIDITSSL